MIDKETFCNIINKIIEVNEKLDKLQEVNSGMALAIVEEYSLQDELIAVLEKVMDLPVDEQIGSSISWWIYDTQFGKDRPYIYIDKDEHDENKIKIDTVEKLYDWCLEESELNKKYENSCI